MQFYIMLPTPNVMILFYFYILLIVQRLHLTSYSDAKDKESCLTSQSDSDDNSRDILI